jgi:Tfp pilus assembly protein PilV
MSSARRRSARRASRGISLVDALAATALLGIGVLGLSGNTVLLTRASKTADSASAATALAQQKLEQLRSTPLGAPALLPGIYNDPLGTMKADGTAIGPFRRTWTVSPVDTPRFGLKTVTVTVTWTDSRAHQTRIAAYVRCSKIPC